MQREYKDWLLAQGYGQGTIVAQIHRVGRVEEHYGDLDTNFVRDGLSSLIEALTYSAEDERQGKPNSTDIPFVGNVRNNLASYKSAVLWYRRYRESGNAGEVAGGFALAATEFPPQIKPASRIGIVPQASDKAHGDPQAAARTLLEPNR